MVDGCVGAYRGYCYIDRGYGVVYIFFLRNSVVHESSPWNAAGLIEKV